MSGSINNTKNGNSATAKTICLDGADRKVTSVNLPVTTSNIGSLAAGATNTASFDLGADYEQYESVILTLNCGVSSPGSQITSVWGGDTSGTPKYPLLNLLTNKAIDPVPVETVQNRYAVAKFAVVSRYLILNVTAGSAAFVSATVVACPGQ